MRDQMTATFRRLIHLLLFAALLLPGLAASAQLGQEQVTPAIIAKAGSIQPGEPFTAAVRFDIRDKWHLYWTNPEGDGFAPEVNWNLPEGYTVSKARWPAPHTFEFLGGIQFGYENELTLLFDITAPADAAGQAVVLQAELTWLVCDSGNCVPNKGYPDPITVERVLPISGEAPKPSADSALIEAAEQQVPGSAEGWSFNTERTGAGFILTINTPSEADAKEIDGLYFYSSEQFAVDPQAEQAAEVKGKAVQLKLTERKTDPYGDPIEREQPITTLNGVLTAKSGFGDTGLSAMIVGAYTSAPAAANTPDPNDAPLTTTQEPVLGFMVAIGFAFVGGLILNLMPCVFPVLSIKILGFVNQAGENPAIVRRHGYAFGIGVLLSFWALVAVLLILRSIAQAAAESSGATAGSVGWGFQLQEPAFVLAMLMLVFLIGLNLIGAFEVGIGLSAAAGKASQTSKDGYGKSFLTGVLATLIATPCTGPFMAPALGAAIAMPTYQAILVFTALGIGMATPYVVLSCFPALLNYLPRPGAWMESFKQAMAFPMFATAGWLAWVYIGLTSDDFGLVILICLSIVALGAWVYGRWSTPIRSTRTRWIARIVALVFVAGGIGYIHIGASAIEAQRIAAQMAREAGEYVYEWVDYSPEKVAALRETGRPVLIDFTAKWCATCQVNKRTSLRTSAAQKLYKQYNVALVEADNTRPNPDIVKTLEQHQRAGVPLYLVFPAGDPDAAPQVLPEVLTPQMVEDAIKQAADANEGDSPVAVNR